MAPDEVSIRRIICGTLRTRIFVRTTDFVSQTIELARRGAFISMFGCCPAGEKIEVEPFQIYWKELRITGSFINPFCFEEAVSLLKDLKGKGLLNLDKLGVRVFDLKEYEEALKSLKTGTAAKVMFKLH